jgi:hypothetical protein
MSIGDVQVDDLLHRPHRRQGLVRVDASDDAADRFHHIDWHAGGPHHQVLGNRP